MVAKRFKRIEKEEEKPLRGKALEKFKKIARAVTRRTKPASQTGRRTSYGLEELIAITRKKRKTKGETERLKKEKIVQKRAEILYRLDPLVFSGVNRLKRLVLSPRIFFVEGDEEERKKMQAWARDVGLKKVLGEAIQDIIIYGYALIEKVRDNKGLVVRLVTVDPKTIDWKKEGDKLVLDKAGEPEGFVQTPEEGGEDIFLPRNDAILLNFFTLGRECLGISALEPAFKASWIRLNLEEAYGEAIYRHGFPLYYFKVGDKDHPISAELIKEARKVLKDLDTAQELVLPHWIEPGRLDPKSEIREIINLWVFLAGELARALDSPLSFLTPMAGGRESKGTIEFSSIDLEKAIKEYQQRIKDQLEEQLLAEVRVVKELESIPELEFSESSPQNQLLRMRMISMLSARGALHVDTKTENKLRQELNLPTLDETSEDLSCVFNLVDSCPIRNNRKDISSKELADFCKVCPLKESMSKEVKKKRKVK